MSQVQKVSLLQMKEALTKEAGSNFPMKITRKDGEVMIRYVRGFADQPRNVLLISETSFSIAMNIIEVKDIYQLEYSSEDPDGRLKVFMAKWLCKTTKPDQQVS